ncbi:hypothetical protein BLOT_016822 [Blomia tropicalis]|nr:hypothetical protein BLOT_016822 [Blomia tropicalis]
MIESFGLLVALGTLLYSTIFSSDITSLILSKTELKFDTLDQLIEHEDYGILVKKRSQLVNIQIYYFVILRSLNVQKVIPHIITEINYYWPNGTFKGALGLMWEDKIDFVPYPHAVTEERLKILKLDNVVAIDDKISILSFPRLGT